MQLNLVSCILFYFWLNLVTLIKEKKKGEVFFAVLGGVVRDGLTERVTFEPARGQSEACGDLWQR